MALMLCVGTSSCLDFFLSEPGFSGLRDFQDFFILSELAQLIKKSVLTPEGFENPEGLC